MGLKSGRLVAVFAAVATLAVCSAYGDPYPADAEVHELVVHGLLIADRAEQEIVVEYVRPISDGMYRGLSPASGAAITVEAHDGTMHRFEEVVDSPGVYRAMFTPRAGERWTLRVVDGAGEVVTGATVIPEPTILHSPEADTVIVLPEGAFGGTRIALRWSPADGAGYVIAYRWLDSDQPSNVLTDLLYAYTTVLNGLEASAPIGSWMDYTAGARVGVATVDSMYARYVSAFPRETVPRSRARSTLEGGYGLFGSVAFSEFRRVEVQRPWLD